MIDAPIALAFAAGLVAAFNPCGFAMLPAYLSYFIGVEGRRERDVATGLGRAVAVAATVSAGFALVFGVAGVGITRFSLGVQRVAPWFAVVVGLALVPLGVAMLRGFEPKLSLPRLQRGGQDRGLSSMFLFGVSYAIVSLSCTLPVFLAAVATTFDRASFLSGLTVFAAYAGGMTLVLGVLTIALALARHGLVSRMKGMLPVVNRISGGLLMVAGLYVAYYGYFALRLERGDDIAAGPVDWIGAASAAVANRVDRIGPVALGIVLTAIVAAALLVTVAMRRGPKAITTDDHERGARTDRSPARSGRSASE